MPSNVLPLHLNQIFLPIIWILPEGEGDEIETSLPFKIFSTLHPFLFTDIWKILQTIDNLYKNYMCRRRTFL